MALFNRRKQEQPVLPEEVRQYYDSERRERRGRAWLLAFATLLVTFLLAAALFFAGRWLYRAVFDNDNKKTTTTSQNQDKDTRSNGSSSDKSDSEDTDTDINDTKPTTQGTTTPPNEASNGTNKPPVTPPTTKPPQLIDTGPGNE